MSNSIYIAVFLAITVALVSKVKVRNTSFYYLSWVLTALIAVIGYIYMQKPFSNEYHPLEILTNALLSLFCFMVCVNSASNLTKVPVAAKI